MDVVFNHMTGTRTTKDVGTGNSYADSVELTYPDVPYSKSNFHWPACGINNWGNATQVMSKVKLLPLNKIKK